MAASQLTNKQVNKRSKTISGRQGTKDAIRRRAKYIHADPSGWRTGHGTFPYVYVCVCACCMPVAIYVYVHVFVPVYVDVEVGA